MRIHRLATIEGFVAFDMECPMSAGGTRLAEDVTEAETALLARAMTYKFAVFGHQIGGAKAGIRATQAGRAPVLAAYCEEIRPMVERGEFLTASDLGTRTQDFATLDSGASFMHEEDGNGVTFDAEVTGLGVVVGAEAAAGDLGGRSIAIEGFGKVGGTAAEEAVRRGARIVGLSTVYGAILDKAGFGIDRLLELRATYGDRFVEHAGADLLPPAALFAADADILVPGARTGVVDETVAARVSARIVAPAANVPYTPAGLAVLESRGVRAMADFVCNGGGVGGYMAERAGVRGKDALRAAVEKSVRGAAERSLDHPEGPFAGACAAAEEFLLTWRDADTMPDRRPLAA